MEEEIFMIDNDDEASARSFDEVFQKGEETRLENVKIKREVNSIVNNILVACSCGKVVVEVVVFILFIVVLIKIAFFV